MGIAWLFRFDALQHGTALSPRMGYFPFLINLYIFWRREEFSLSMRHGNEIYIMHGCIFPLIHGIHERIPMSARHVNRVTNVRSLLQRGAVEAGMRPLKKHIPPICQSQMDYKYIVLGKNVNGKRFLGEKDRSRKKSHFFRVWVWIHLSSRICNWVRFFRV